MSTFKVKFARTLRDPGKIREQRRGVLPVGSDSSLLHVGDHFSIAANQQLREFRDASAISLSSFRRILVLPPIYAERCIPRVIEVKSICYSRVRDSKIDRQYFGSRNRNYLIPEHQCRLQTLRSGSSPPPHLGCFRDRVNSEFPGLRSFEPTYGTADLSVHRVRKILLAKWNEWQIRGSRERLNKGKGKHFHDCYDCADCNCRASALIG